MRRTAIKALVGVSLLVARLTAQEPVIQLRRGDGRGAEVRLASALRLDDPHRVDADARDAVQAPAAARPARRCSKVKRTLVGLAIGVAAAAPLAWAIDKRFENEGDSAGDYVALTLAGGAGAGALVGWFTCP